MRDLAPDADLETLYTAAKFAAAREDRRITHSLLRDMRGLPLSSEDAAGPLMISGESDGSSDPTFAAREPRAPAAHVADRVVHRHDGDSTGMVLGCLLLTDGVRDFRTGPLDLWRCPRMSCPDRMLRGRASASRIPRGETKELFCPGIAPLGDAIPRGGRRLTS